MTPCLSCNNFLDMIDCGTIPVWVTEVRYTGGGFAFGRGETEDGDRVEFAGEPRALSAISEALEAGDGPVLAAIPTWWSIIRRPSLSTKPAA